MVNMEEQLRVRITGGPPWGFRLVGGIEQGQPVSISKIRKRSKADYADLQEGDRVLSINGKSVRNAARDVAMSYIDSADDSLDLEIIRTSQRSAMPQTIEQKRPTSIQMNQERRTSSSTIPEKRTSNGSLPPNTTIRKVTTTTTRIQTTKDGDRRHETITKTVTESIDGEPAQTTSRTSESTEEAAKLHEPARKASEVRVVSPTRVDHGRRSSEVTVNTSPKFAPPKPRISSNVTIGQPATITFQSPSKPGTSKPSIWQQQQQPKPTYEPPKPQPKYATFPRQPPPQQQTKQPPTFSKPTVVKPGHVSYQAAQTKQPVYEPVKIQQTGRPGTGSEARYSTQVTRNIMGPKPTAQTTVGRELTITFAMPDQDTQIDYGSPPQSPSGMSVDSGVPPESPVTPAKRLIHDDEDEPKKPVSILDDPSIILRSIGSEGKDRLQRPFSEPAGRVTEEPEVSVVEKRRACKTIADLLMFPKNKQAKGARMFAKRRKRSARYTIEATGMRTSDEESEPTSPTSSEASSTSFTLKGVPGAPPPPPGVPPPPGGGPPPAPPPPPQGFSARLRIEPTNFNINLKSKEKCEHNVVTPKQCNMLVLDLKSQKGRAATMFEKRRERSEQFVLDESTMKIPKPTPFKKPPGPHQASSTAEITVKGPPAKKLTPWEAAMESPVGSVSKAFNNKTVTVKIPPPTEPKPKPPAAWMKTTDMTPKVPAKPPAEPRIKPGFRAQRDLPKFASPEMKSSVPLQPGAKLPKANFKDFNVRARGWGSGSADNTPGSPASMNSDQGVNNTSHFPTKPLKYSGGHNDFNPKPKSFADSRHGALSPTSSLAESDDL